MKEIKYNIEEILEKFLVHAKEGEKEHKALIEQFKENNPGKPLSKYLEDDFNLPMALATICDEILKIKSRI